jgi:CBS domain-containing protein
MNVERVMKKDVRACRPDDTLNRAAQLMWDNACGCVPIVSECDQPIGILTDRDICMAAYTQGRPLSEITVATSMAHKAITCRTEDDVHSVIDLMRENAIRRVPVVDSDGRLRGIVSLDDLASESLRNFRGAINRELANRLGEAFLSICARRARRFAR